MSDGFQTPFGAIREFLDGRKYTYAASEQNQRIGLSMCGRHADYRFILRITNGGDFFQITANYPFRVRDARMRPAVAELLARANYAMLLGKFELDMEDGEARFHITQMIEEGHLGVSTVEKLFLTALHTLDRYFPAFMQLLHAGYTPGDAIFHAELDLHADQIVLPPPAPGAGRGIAPAPPVVGKSESLDAVPATASDPVPPELPAGHPDSLAESPGIAQEETSGEAPVPHKGSGRKSRRVPRRKLTGPEDHPEFPF